jgi:hypothetical protein
VLVVMCVGLVQRGAGGKCKFFRGNVLYFRTWWGRLREMERVLW